MNEQLRLLEELVKSLDLQIDNYRRLCRVMEGQNWTEDFFTPAQSGLKEMLEGLDKAIDLHESALAWHKSQLEYTFDDFVEEYG